MPGAWRTALPHYLGYFGSMVLLWLFMVSSSALSVESAMSKGLAALLIAACLLFGALGAAHVLRGGRHG